MLTFNDIALLYARQSQYGVLAILAFGVGALLLAAGDYLGGWFILAAIIDRCSSQA